METFRCPMCNKNVPVKYKTQDHLIPKNFYKCMKSITSGNAKRKKLNKVWIDFQQEANTVCMCEKCNKAKGSKLLSRKKLLQLTNNKGQMKSFWNRYKFYLKIYRRLGDNKSGVSNAVFRQEIRNERKRLKSL